MGNAGFNWKKRVITRPPLSRQSGILVLKVQIKGVRGFKGACNSNVRTTTLPVSGSGFRMAAYNRSILFGLRPQKQSSDSRWTQKKPLRRLYFRTTDFEDWEWKKWKRKKKGKKGKRRKKKRENNKIHF